MINIQRVKDAAWAAGSQSASCRETELRLAAGCCVTAEPTSGSLFAKMICLAPHQRPAE